MVVLLSYFTVLEVIALRDKPNVTLLMYQMHMERKVERLFTFYGMQQLNNF